MSKIIISGAGLVGSLLAIYLSKRGFEVEVYERLLDMRLDDLGSGRSINLALSNRGLRALNEVGLMSEIEKIIIPMFGRMMHDIDGNLTQQPYGKDGQSINSISRAGLNMLLMDHAERAGVKFYFNHPTVDIDLDNTQLKVENNGNVHEKTADIIVGADGAFSPVRGVFQITERYDYSQSYIEHGYKELTIPALRDGDFLLEKNSLHIWPRGNYMLIALPNLDGSFTCTLFFPFEGNPSFSSIRNRDQLFQFFSSTFPDARDLIPDLENDFFNNPSSSLVTVKCYPWVKNKTFLIGDAAHAVVPFYGQGMNCGFEDCRILNKLLDEHSDNWEFVLEAYQLSRKPNADAISDLALSNFIEMRDLVADKNFLLQKAIEARLHEKYPEKWIPLYSMVTFNENTPYSEAKRSGEIQNLIMKEIMNSSDFGGDAENFNYGKAIEKLDKFTRG